MTFDIKIDIDNNDIIVLLFNRYTARKKRFKKNYSIEIDF